MANFAIDGKIAIDVKFHVSETRYLYILTRRSQVHDVFLLTRRITTRHSTWIKCVSVRYM